MTIQRLETVRWKGWLDDVSRHLPSTHVGIQVMGLDLGDQEEARSLSLLGMSYDPTRHSLQVSGESLDHLISDPKEIFLDVDDDGRLKRMEITDGDGRKQLLEFEPPLPMPKA